MRSKIIFVSILALLTSNIYSQQWLKYNPEISNSPPKIGLVLGGGGALGMAHIAVLKMLEEYNIPVDYIAGTSMGAIIGALYSCGYTASEIEKIIYEVNWDTILGDSIDRMFIKYDDREIYEKHILSIGIEKLKPVLPEGLSYGQNFYNMLYKLTWRQKFVRDFDKLPIPFKCIATDIITGEPVILEKGNLADAVRASMSIPSLFSPVEIDGHLLVDGGLSRNLPVLGMRERGADIVIAVDVGAPAYKKEELDSFPKVLDQVTIIFVKATAEKEEKFADKVISPTLGDFNSYSFSKIQEIMEIGEASVEKERNFFIELAALFEEKNKTAEKRKTAFVDDKPILINKIEISKNEKVSDMKIIRTMNIHEGSIISEEDLLIAMEKLYGRGDFNTIRYSIDRDYETDKNILKITTIESTERVVYLSADYNTDAKASIFIESVCKNLLFDDTKLDTKINLSENFLVNIKYYKNFPGFANIDIGIDTGISRRYFYCYEDGNKQAECYSDLFNFYLFIEKPLSHWFYVGAAAEVGFSSYEESIGDSYLDDSTNYYKLRLYFEIDTLDSIIYPKKGFRLWTSGEKKFLADSFLPWDIDSPNDGYYQIKSFAELHFSPVKFLTLNAASVYCSVLNNRDKSAGFIVGGYNSSIIERNFVGYKGLLPGYIITDSVAQFELSVNLRFLKNFVFTPYYSRLYYGFDNYFKHGESVNSFGATLAYITSFIGPIEISIAKADVEDSPVFYFNIGFTF